MKKHLFLSIIVTASYLSVFAIADSPINPKISQDIKVVCLTSLSDNDLKEIMQGEHPTLAVEFTEQTWLPVSFYLKGNLVNLIESDEKLGTLEIKQTFYARCAEGQLFFSSNLTEWVSFLEFITGTASITLSIQDGHPSIAVSSETNRRS